MKKIVCLFLAALTVLSFLTACREKESAVSVNAAKPVKISFLSNIPGGKTSALEDAVIAFQKETGIEVDFSSPGGNYENIMKENMATGKMPDVFTTHGWSVKRYGRYLLPLNRLPFSENISSYIKPIVTDTSGALLALPIDIDISGIVYNPEVLQKSGVSAGSLLTWDDFAAACRKIRRAGYDPISISARDGHSAGQLLDRISSSFFVTDDKNNQKEALLSGTFDTAAWKKAAGMMFSWKSSGFYNSNAETCSYPAAIQLMAEGQAGFLFSDNSAMIDVQTISPKAHLAIMPIPSASWEDSPTLVIGEGVTVGIWKNSEHQVEAKKFLEYLARPEIAAKLADADGKSAALTNARSSHSISLGGENIRTFPYFDRWYLPTGMWDVLCNVGTDILSGTSGAVNRSAETMQRSYKDKFYFDRS